jgi:hypothetical protein
MLSPEASWAINSISGFRTIWDPHWGCAVLAGRALLEEQLVEPEARPYVQGVIDSIINSHPIGRPSQRISDGPRTKSDVLSILTQDDPKVSQLGHDAIYSAYIFSAMATDPQLESGPMWASAVRLLNMIKNSGPGWITINGKNTVLPVPIVPNARKLRLITQDDVMSYFSDFNRSERMERGDQQLGHLLTHGHSIYRLYQLGYRDLADAASLNFSARIETLNHANQLENHEKEGACAYGLV